MGSSPKVVRDEPGLARYLAGWERAAHTLAARIGLAWWNKYTGSDDGGRDLPDLQQAQSQLLLDPALGELVARWRPRLGDPDLRRKLVVLEAMVLRARVEAEPDVFVPQLEIIDRILSFRPLLRGRSVSHAERNRVLHQEPDRRLRREAWLSVAPLAADLGRATAELIGRRNELARRHGWPDYVDLALGLSSLTRAEVVGVIEHLERSSRAEYARVLGQAAATDGIDTVGPWDVPYLFEKVAAVPVEPFPRRGILPSLEEFLRSFGQDPSRLAIRVVAGDIPFGGLCLAVDPPRDVRVLADPQDGHHYYALLYHEYGHALHALHAGRNSYILQDEPGVFAEGMAQVWSWFTSYPEWLAARGADPGVVRCVRQARAVRLMASHRSFAAGVMWELGAYADPGQDLDALDARISQRYRLAWGGDDPVWAASPFASSYPVYRQNYILADIIAAATHRSLYDRFGDRVLGNPEVFGALVETYWRPGASKPWRERLRDFTGGGLDVSALDYRADAG